MSVLILLMAFWSNDTHFKTLDLELLGFFHQSTYIYPIHHGYLIVGRVDHLLVIVDRSGRETARYDRVGVGPDELNFPKYFGTYKGGLVFVNNKFHFTVMDPKLKVSTIQLPKLNQYVKNGLIFENGEIFALTGSLSGHLAIHYALDGNQWSEQETRFPFKIDYHNLRPPSLALFRESGYVDVNGKPKDGLYSFDYYPAIKNNEKAATLYGPVESLEEKGHQIFAYLPQKWRDKHFIKIEKATLKTLKVVEGYYDMINEQGQLMDRIPRELETRLVILSDDLPIYEMNFETMQLAPWQAGLILMD